MKFKLCVTIFLLLMAAACILLIVTLFPLLVFPAFTDQNVDYEPVPATCVVNKKEILQDQKRCRTWTSCKQGCRTYPKRCFRVLVNYYRSKYEHDSRLEDGTDTPENTTWTEQYVPLRINPMGCGDFPDVDCEYFEKSFELRKTFQCYYSRRNPRDVVLGYTWMDEYYPKLLAVGLPMGLFSIFLMICGILAFWYCRASPGYERDTIGEIETARKYAFE